MPRGGKRSGAGRKSGDAWDGVKPRSVAMRELARERVRTVLTQATDPLAVLTEIAADTSVDAQLRVAAASAACPYLFPRLSAALVAHTDTAPQHESAAIVERLMSRLGRLAPSIEHAPEAVDVLREAPEAVAA